MAATKKKPVKKECVLPAVLYNALLDICDDGYDEVETLLKNNTAIQIIDAVKKLFNIVKEEKEEARKDDIDSALFNIEEVVADYISEIKELSNGKKTVEIKLVDV